MLTLRRLLQSERPTECRLQPSVVALISDLFSRADLLKAPGVSFSGGAVTERPMALTWDLALVLYSLCEPPFELLESVDLKVLSYKTALLMALTSHSMGWLAGNGTFHSNIPEAADLVVAVVYSIFGVCSLVGNTILLYVSYNKKMLLKPAEFFIINLAVSDLGMTLSLYPLAVTSSIYHRWLYGKTVCLVYAFCGVLFGICSLTTLTILSTVCCLKVCYPLYGNRFSPDHGRILIACAWAYALVFACSPLAHWGAYGPEPYGTACCIDWQRSNWDGVARSYTVALFLCCYILPCCVITSAYSQILVTVRESRRAVEQHVSQQTRMGNVQTTIVKLSVAVCIGFFAAWSPYALVSMWAAFGHMDSIPPMAFAIPAVLAKSSTLYNPLVCLLLKPNFRHLLSKDLHSLHRACVFQCRCVRRLSE
ncbi:opsin-5 [Salmo salar]|uniref:Opsin-5 n=1 Tax=Salmo salar TaxID=8030 RepID=A0ABM3CDM0_SALSA|nr:opsin-5 [Salmo salar]